MDRFVNFKWLKTKANIRNFNRRCNFKKVNLFFGFDWDFNSIFLWTDYIKPKKNNKNDCPCDYLFCKFKITLNVR